MIRLYTFLGNTGREHRDNRHNVAWLFLETLPFAGELRWERGFRGRYATRDSGERRTWFLKPDTYMNLSGDSVAELARFHRIDPRDILAIHDEIELPFGTFGFKFGGGLGGHNGLRSMEARLATRDFARLRFGVGRPGHEDIAGYVLSDFTRGERELLDTSVFCAAAKAFELCMELGIDEAIARHRRTQGLP